MPDSLDDIVVLPKMNHSSQKGRMFRLRWVIDLVSDSRNSYVNLVFQSTQGNFIHVDTIPPELLSYCTIGSRFVNGRRFYEHRGTKHTFTIKSSNMNKFVEAREAFTDKDFDLSLKSHNQTFADEASRKTFEGWRQHYSNKCQQQLCFVQQDGPVKIIIPCFVIAATYYFESTSLREAVLSRRLDSLYHSCTVDTNSHATIELKSAGNIGDAFDIARLKLDPFANERFNLCKNHLSAKENKMVQRIKADFPVEQELTITARGEMVNHDDGSKTFIVFDILSEDSQFPFKSIDIRYQKDEAGFATDGIGGGGTFPQSRKGSSGNMSIDQPAHGYVRHLLESCKPADNPNLESIKAKKIQVKKPKLDEQKTPETIYDDETKDLSTQPPTTGDQSASKAEVRKKDDSEKKPKTEFPIDAFIQMVLPLQNELYTIQIKEKDVKVSVENFNKSESLVPRRTKGGKYVTLRESYSNKVTNLRRCVYVNFTCMGFYVCLVEIDQTKAKNIGCSTRILVSGSEIDKKTAEKCAKYYVDEKLLKVQKTELAKAGIVLKTHNHPESGDDEAMKLWRQRLLKRICV